MGQLNGSNNTLVDGDMEFVPIVPNTMVMLNPMKYLSLHLKTI
jgi:hypothetical protein